MNKLFLKDDLETDAFIRGWESVNTRLNELAYRMEQDGNYEVASQLRSTYNQFDLDEEMRNA
jgi:hypothetical protein